MFYKKVFTLIVVVFLIASFAVIFGVSGCKDEGEESTEKVCRIACEMMETCGKVADAGSCRSSCVTSGLSQEIVCVRDAENCAQVEYCMNGGGCTCDISSSCDPGCDCDPDCTSTCSCDISSSCDPGCDCDPDCESTCSCDISSSCDLGCDCDPDCLCSNSCTYSNDGECDDGGPGSSYNECEYGTDCADCGSRDPSVACHCDIGSGCDYPNCDCDPDCETSVGQYGDSCDCSEQFGSGNGRCSADCSVGAGLYCYWWGLNEEGVCSMPCPIGPGEDCPAGTESCETLQSTMDPSQYWYYCTPPN